MKLPEIFISYSWTNKKIADKVYYDLTLVGFTVIKDDHTLKYTDRISDFMKKIRKANFALLIICDNYLKSINCMSEVLQLSKDENIWDKILPVVCDDAKIYDAIERINYVSYWQEKSAAIENTLKNIDPINATNIYAELRSYKEITQNIDSFLFSLKDKINTTPEKLFNDFYSPIIKKMGAEPDFTKMALLIPISAIKDPKTRLLKINSYIKSNVIENSYCFSIIGSCYRDMKQSKKAIQFYKKSVSLDEYNYVAWNNLGQVYQNFNKNYFAAKDCYEKAIIAKPDFDIPKLNLGVLLSNHLNDTAGAKKQYEEILKFDENNAKAHNNLANIYRSKEFEDFDKVEKHLLIAITQNNIEALINYANHLKVYKKDIELGNSYYLKAKELDTDNMYGEIIDIMIKSNKG